MLVFECSTELKGPRWAKLNCVSENLGPCGATDCRHLTIVLIHWGPKRGLNQALGDARTYGEDWPNVMLNVKINLLEGYWQRFQTAQRQLLVWYADVDGIHEIEATTSNTYAASKAELYRLKKVIQDAQSSMRSLKTSERYTCQNSTANIHNRRAGAPNSKRRS